MREVKLAATLKRLVDEGEFQGNRRQVCAELNITPAALSQYIRGQTMPSVEKLIAMADLFKVSLDFLMFGEDTVAGPGGVLEYGPIARYMEVSISSIRADIAAETAFVAKIGTILTDQITEAARTAARRAMTLHGMLDRVQILELERFSEDSTIVTGNLDDDIVEVNSDIERGMAAGNFITVVAENLAKKRRYHFVLSPDMPDREQVAQRYRTLLLGKGLSRKDLERCRFSVAASNLFVGFGLYTLDVDGLRRKSPVLFQYVEPYLGNGGRVGYIEPPSSPFQAFFLMDRGRQQSASEALARLCQ
ncbi:helix-turn-helix domain-containing protein [Nocardia arthritidis]|uniref:Helix-turn-helix domain-containing protein n=1 Tax=Nocardia arthritidis TaxID=228602 RepID=A0A6G9YEG5_9NOCA|nr:helix-turn-helix transcriptional regulator [Nocardia arthritidis]QIS11467.1 helix-turn-helix domain-containing protein [Nocardia arthritidis]